MKTCPKCKMTLDAHCECPACRNDITKLPYSDLDIEKYAFNKYFLLYVFKIAKFFVAMVLGASFLLIIKWPNIKPIYLLSFLFLLICFGESFYPNLMKKIWQVFYSESYLEATSKITKYASGFLSIFIILFF